MFSDEEIKENSLSQPDDDIISVHEVYFNDKYDKKDFGFNSEPLLYNSGNSNLDAIRYFRDGFLEGLEHQQAKFAWTEEDDNIASLVSSPGFDIDSSFGKELDAALTSELKEADTSSPGPSKKDSFVFSTKPTDSNVVSSTSGNSTANDKPKSKNVYKIDKEDPRSRQHFFKYVKRHERTIKLWECGICGREFQHQYTLMRHLPTHTDERNYHCEECSKSFRQLSTLSQHRAIHSAERPYACEVCNKTFNRVSTLISHRKTHSEEKPYRCHICPKGFHQKGNLRNHLFTHTNERPYRCNICQKGFNQQSNLVCHKNKAHPDNKETISIERVVCQPLGPSTSNTKATNYKNRPPSQQCEVSSSSGPYPPESPLKPQVTLPKTSVTDGLLGGGVIVDPIMTIHMGVAMATKQTPFALLQLDTGIPVLVKIVDTELPGGKQMLVPATAEDLLAGGKVVMKEDCNNLTNGHVEVETVAKDSPVQIRVPVVATVVPKIKPGGGLQLSVEEPHHDYHTAVSSDNKTTTCATKENRPGCRNSVVKILSTEEINNKKEENLINNSGSIISSSMPPPAPSPPIDLISLDLFEPMECMPLGPPAANDDHSPNDSDIFIPKFEEIIPLSDSE